jgi:hypothetical protein
VFDEYAFPLLARAFLLLLLHMHLLLLLLLLDAQ